MDTTNSSSDTVIPAQTRDMLEKSLGNPHPIVRCKGIEAALRLGTRAVIPLLLPLLRDGDARARSAAIAGLARIATEADEPEIARFSVDANTTDLVVFVDELRTRRHERALWLALLRGKCASVIRLAAIEVLSTEDDLEAIRALIEAAAAEDSSVRGAAGEVLRNHYEWIRSGAAEEALPALERARASGSLAVQQAAGAWCERIRAAQLRRKMVESGVASVMAVTTALRSRSPVMRQAAAEACGKLADVRATPALAQCLQDSDSEVRHAVAVALSNLGWQAETADQHGALLAALGQFQSACELGAAGVDAIGALLSHLSEPEQISAVTCMAETQSIRAMNPLLVLLDSTAPSVRQAAAHALRKLEWVPPTSEQSLKFALAIEDWRAAAAQGTGAITALILLLKESRDNAHRFSAIENALYGVQDANTATIFMDLCRDGDVAGIAVNALVALLSQPEISIPTHLLEELATMEDVVQFRYAPDPQYSRHVRAGIEPVSAELLRSTAASRLASMPAGAHTPREHVTT